MKTISLGMTVLVQLNQNRFLFFLQVVHAHILTQGGLTQNHSKFRPDPGALVCTADSFLPDVPPFFYMSLLRGINRKTIPVTAEPGSCLGLNCAEIRVNSRNSPQPMHTGKLPEVPCMGRV